MSYPAEFWHFVSIAISFLLVLASCTSTGASSLANSSENIQTASRESTSAEVLPSVLLQIPEQIGNRHEGEGETEKAITQHDLELHKKQVEEMIQELKDEHRRFQEETLDQLAKIQTQLSELREQQDSARALTEEQSGNFNGQDVPEEKPHLERILQLHQKHEGEIRRMDQVQSAINDTLRTIDTHVAHFSRMHNIKERLKHTAALLVEERWYEASLHWTFAENHILHDPSQDANQVISDHLRTVITFAYAHDKLELGDQQWNSRAHIHTRAARLIPIFKFVHKLSYKEYKVYAYETLIHQLLTDSIFDGWEIFAFSYYVRKNYGLNSKGQRLLPKLAQMVASGSSSKLLYVEFLKSAQDAQNSRVPRPQGRDNVTFDLHVKYDMVKKKNLDGYKSFEYPVYGSNSNSYTPLTSGTWFIDYQLNGYFTIRNGANEGYLNVPGPADENESLLNTAPELNKSKYNLEFQLIFLSNSTFGIQATVSDTDERRQAVLVGTCGQQYARSAGQSSNSTSTSLCFQLSNLTSDTRDHWQAGQFTVEPSTRI